MRWTDLKSQFCFAAQSIPQTAQKLPLSSALCVMTDLNEPSAKVLFRVTNEDGSTEVETLWAFALGDSRYKIDNLPFFAYGVSLHDIVHAPLNTVEGFATFERVVSKSGNRTIRVIFEPALADDNDSHKILSGLVALGVEYEGANRSYVVLNLPPR
ncbi:MAG: DUF4265 domain-containing protein [Uliginosibacterium sp.]|nr:DUF4265 domain-containing protein [Uliginosibacterium sp.]